MTFPTDTRIRVNGLPVEYATPPRAVVDELRNRAADVAEWHQPSRHHGRRSSRNCTECGFPWPCRTFMRTVHGRTE